jgi:C4-dicarboxylate-specific signal transduction histidine kinase
MHRKSTEETTRDEDELRRLLHLLNQPLTAIGNYAEAGRQLIDQGMSDPARLQELFEKIARQSSRAGVIAQDLGSAAGVTKAPE